MKQLGNKEYDDQMETREAPSSKTHLTWHKPKVWPGNPYRIGINTIWRDNSYGVNTW